MIIYVPLSLKLATSNNKISTNHLDADDFH
jgi:hypothetical protein